MVLFERWIAPRCQREVSKHKAQETNKLYCRHCFDKHFIASKHQRRTIRTRLGRQASGSCRNFSMSPVPPQDANGGQREKGLQTHEHRSVLHKQCDVTHRCEVSSCSTMGINKAPV